MLSWVIDCWNSLNSLPSASLNPTSFWSSFGTVKKTSLLFHGLCFSLIQLQRIVKCRIYSHFCFHIFNLVPFFSNILPFKVINLIQNRNLLWKTLRIRPSCDSRYLNAQKISQSLCTSAFEYWAGKFSITIHTEEEYFCCRIFNCCKAEN